MCPRPARHMQPRTHPNRPREGPPTCDAVAIISAWWAITATTTAVLQCTAAHASSSVLRHSVSKMRRMRNKVNSWLDGSRLVPVMYAEVHAPAHVNLSLDNSWGCAYADECSMRYLKCSECSWAFMSPSAGHAFMTTCTL